MRPFRIYREEQLHVHHRGGRKRAMGTRAPMVLPLMQNQRWSLDFVSDQLSLAIMPPHLWAPLVTA